MRPNLFLFLPMAHHSPQLCTDVHHGVREYMSMHEHVRRRMMVPDNELSCTSMQVYYAISAKMSPPSLKSTLTDCKKVHGSAR